MVDEVSASVGEYDLTLDGALKFHRIFSYDELIGFFGHLAGKLEIDIELYEARKKIIMPAPDGGHSIDNLLTKTFGNVSRANGHNGRLDIIPFPSSTEFGRIEGYQGCAFGIGEAYKKGLSVPESQLKLLSEVVKCSKSYLSKMKEREEAQGRLPLG